MAGCVVGRSAKRLWRGSFELSIVATIRQSGFTSVCSKAHGHRQAGEQRADLGVQVDSCIRGRIALHSCVRFRLRWQGRIGKVDVVERISEEEFSEKARCC